MPNGRPMPDPTPNNDPTASVRPSALTSRLVGYQLVGIRPRNVPRGRPYTATAFAPPSATNSVFASGDRATAVGARPILRWRNGATAIDCTTALRRVSITLTVSELPLATYRRAPRSSQASPVGWRPTGITVALPLTKSTRVTLPGCAIPRASTRTSSADGSQHCLEARSCARGFLPPSTETYATAPSWLTTAATGKTPSGIVFRSVPLSASKTASASLAGSGSTATRCPPPAAFARAATAGAPAMKSPRAALDQRTTALSPPPPARWTTASPS